MELCVSPQHRATVKLGKYGTENCSMKEEPTGGCTEQLKILETEIDTFGPLIDSFHQSSNLLNNDDDVFQQRE